MFDNVIRYYGSTDCIPLHVWISFYSETASDSPEFRERTYKNIVKLTNIFPHLNNFLHKVPSFRRKMGHKETISEREFILLFPLKAHPADVLLNYKIIFENEQPNRQQLELYQEIFPVTPTVDAWATKMQEERWVDPSVAMEILKLSPKILALPVDFQYKRDARIKDGDKTYARKQYLFRFPTRYDPEYQLFVPERKVSKLLVNVWDKWFEKQFAEQGLILGKQEHIDMFKWPLELSSFRKRGGRNIVTTRKKNVQKVSDDLDNLYRDIGLMDGEKKKEAV